VTLTFNLLTLNRCHTWRVTWPTLPTSMKTIRQSVLQFWVLTFPVGYYWKCVRGHCSCAESCDPWVGGQKQFYFWNPRPRFVYSLYNFYWAPTTIKGRLLSSCPMLKPFSGAKIRSPVEMAGGPKMAVFGENRNPNLRYWFRDPQKELPCAEPRRLTYLRQNRCARLGCSLSQEPQ